MTTYSIGPIIIRDAANTAALRNGANAQAFNVYNLYTDASNYERAVFGWNGVANRLQCGAQSAGTGVSRPLDLFGNSISIYPNGVGSNVGRVDFSPSGWMGFDVDNTYDFGNVAANRPRNIFAGTSVVTPATGYVKTTATTVAALPAAATAGAGARAFVTDATATTFLSTVTGGGANKVPVVSDGTNWLIG